MPITIPSVPFTLPTTESLPPAPLNTYAVGTYTFATVDLNATGLFTVLCAATIPSGLGNVGDVISVIQFGTGQFSVSPGAGVTLFPNGSATIPAPYGAMALLQAQTNVWVAFGNFF